MSEKNEKSKKGSVVLKICLSILVMVIAIALCLIVLSRRENESNPEESISVSTEESSKSFVPESSYEINLQVGQTCNAEITDFETDSTPIWMSSDNSIATVDSSGVITAVSEGTCTVTVAIMDIDQNIIVTVNVSK